MSEEHYLNISANDVGTKFPSDYTVAHVIFSPLIYTEREREARVNPERTSTEISHKVRQIGGAATFCRMINGTDWYKPL